MACGGKPRLRRAVRVNRRGSSQSLDNTWHTDTLKPNHNGLQSLTVIGSFTSQQSSLRVLPYNSSFNQFDDLSFGDDSVGEIESAVFPLHRAVHIKSVAQPEIRRPPETYKHETWMLNISCSHQDAFGCHHRIELKSSDSKCHAIIKAVQMHPNLISWTVKCICFLCCTWPGTLWCRESVWYVQWNHTDSVCSHTWGICTCRHKTR